MAFSMNLLLTAILGIAIAGLVGVYVSDLVQDVQDDQTTGSAAYNTSKNVQTGLTKITSKFGTLGSISILVIIVGALVSVAAFFLTRRNA